MPADCGVLFGIREGIVDKIQDINSSIEGITQNIIGAEIALAGAEAGAAVCLFMGPTPAAAACGAAVVIAVAAAAAAVAYYQSELEKAEEALQEAQHALDEVDGLLSHCQALQSWQQEAADALASEAPTADGIPDPPDADDSSALDEAEEALAELEALGEDRDDSYA
ncbi:MAG: hypothetical protein NTW42_01795 [Deltaproteobacteria bacterium]|nr:hypothetical protein [Deltaproteobacteria bacterium]